MKFDDIVLMVQNGFDSGAMYQADDGNVYGVEGHSLSLPVLGALTVCIDDRRFNVYCENQKRLTNFFNSRQNPLSMTARDLLKREHRDEKKKRALDRVWGAFIGPLADEHVRRGGDPVTQDQARATCAMFLSKVACEQMEDLILPAPIQQFAEYLSNG